MRPVSRRFRALIGHLNEWVTEVDWSNDGGRTWTPAAFVSGTVTRSLKSQIHWTSDLVIAEADMSLASVNAYHTTLRVRHGIRGLPLLAMGRYKVASVSRSSLSVETLTVRGESFETYLIHARFLAPRTFYAGPARELLERLIREVIPSALITWEIEDDGLRLGQIVEPRDRWPLIDGKRDSISIARSLSARVITGPGGDWRIVETPALTDPVRWSAKIGDVLLENSEELTDAGLCNAMVVSGELLENEQLPFPPAAALDDDPSSPTFTGRPVDEGGLGVWPEFYTSQFITTAAQASKVARSMLAERLGLRQNIAFTTAHDPTIEPGDVGEVETVNGFRRVIPDAVTYDLLGGPMGMETRTTATRLAGSVVEAPEET